MFSGSRMGMTEVLDSGSGGGGGDVVGSLPATRIDDARDWLFGRALPFWSRTGVDRGRGFVEHLTRAARPADVHYKRLRVQARQVYVFSHASLIGYEGGLEAAANGWRFMCEHAWRPGGGWARRLGRDGGVLDPTLDLYDQAFGLLATAWWIRASGDAAAVERADDTLAAIDERLASPPGRGWLSERGDAAALLQNPHMHLLEALLALHDATGEERFAARAREVVDLFESAFFDPATGTLAEYFDPGWRRAAGERGRIVEPGHHYEWVWLLHRAAPIAPGATRHADALFAFAERFGHDPATGLVYDEVLSDGSLRTPSHRCWPNTEALKAHLARFEHEGAFDGPRATRILDNLFGRYLRAPVPGTWIEQLDDRCAPQGEKIPASTLYHVFVGFSELLRLEPRLRTAGALR
jgi:mannose/cellobiose epimerase-like protein (N-acyl-D-glucosamine 2-epimerase family)